MVALVGFADIPCPNVCRPRVSVQSSEQPTGKGTILNLRFGCAWNRYMAGKVWPVLESFFFGEMVEDYDGTWGGASCGGFVRSMAVTWQLVKFWTSNLNFWMPWFL